jgi:hypothetical protein
VSDSYDPDDDPGALAQALDAAIDAAQLALADDNPAQAAALLTAAEATSDALLAVLGLPDADEPEGEGAG